MNRFTNMVKRIAGVPGYTMTSISVDDGNKKTLVFENETDETMVEISTVAEYVNELKKHVTEEKTFIKKSFPEVQFKDETKDILISSKKFQKITFWVEVEVTVPKDKTEEFNRYAKESSWKKNR